MKTRAVICSALVAYFVAAWPALAKDLQKELAGRLPEKKERLRSLEERPWTTRECLENIESAVKTLWELRRLREEVEIDQRFIEDGFTEDRYEFQKAEYLEALIERLRQLPILTILRTQEGRDCDDISPRFKYLQIKFKEDDLKQLQEELEALR